MRVFAFTCGWLTGPLHHFLAGEPGRIRVPVPSFLIEHPRGRVVFDTGLHRDVQHDPAGRLRAHLTVYDVEFAPGEDIAARLTSVEVDAEAVDILVTSHLHFDHAGGNAALPNARWVIQRREWQAGTDPEVARRNFMSRCDFDLGHDRLEVDDEYDLFGDGAVVCVPTFGHTPGHQSLRVRTDDGRTLLLAGDACYLRRTLDTFHLPGVLDDPVRARETLERFRAWRAAGVDIIYGHDAVHWAGVPQAPRRLA